MNTLSDVNNVNSAPVPSGNGQGALQPRPMPVQPVSGTLPLAAGSTAPNALALLQALRRRLVPALIVSLVVAASAAAAVWFLMPAPKITARTQLYVAPAPPRILYTEPNQGSFETERFLRSQAYLIKERFVLNAALREPGIADLHLLKEQPDPLQWLESEIKVDWPSTEFLRISLSGDRPDDQVKIVQAVTKAYLDNVANKEHIERQASLQNLKKLVQRYEEGSRRNRKTLRMLQEKNGAIDEKSLAILQQVALKDLAAAKNDLTQVRQDLRRLQVELGMQPGWVEHIWPQYAAVLNSLPGPGLPINHTVVALLHDEALAALASPATRSLAYLPEVEDALDREPNVAEGMKRMQQLEDVITQKQKSLRPEVFEQQVVAVREELAALEKRVQERRAELRPRILQKYRQRLGLAAWGDRTLTLQKYRYYKDMESVLVGDVKQLADQTKMLNREAVDLAELKEQIVRDEEVTNRANGKITAMEVEQEAPARITQPDKEAVVYTPDAKKRKTMLASGAAVAALALVLLAFAWFEFQSRKVHGPDEVVQGLGLRLVGTVPDHSRRSWLPWRGSDGNSAYTQSLLTESVDAARTMLLHVARQEQLKIVMITSALAGEGKTSLASHLAASLARAGHRTILVDSDLRNPTLHRLFDRSRAPGLSELLRGESDVAGVSRDTGIPNLWLISAGKADAVALQSLSFDSIPKLFEQLRSQYDFVIVDSCPVLPVADTMLVGQHVDAVIFSLLREVSRLPRVQAAYQRLALLGIRMLGAVVNGTQHESYYSSDYRYITPES